MQHHESVSFKKLCHPYDIPTFKNKALRLASIEGQAKRLLLLY